MKASKNPKKIVQILIYLLVIAVTLTVGLYYSSKIKTVSAEEINNSSELSKRIKEYLNNDEVYYAYIRGDIKETQLIAFHEVGFNKKDPTILKYHFYLYVPKNHTLQQVQKDLEMRYIGNRIILMSGNIIEKNDEYRFYLVELTCKNDFDAKWIIDKGVEVGYREYVLGYIPWRYEGVDYQPEHIDRKYTFKGYQKGLDESSKDKNTLVGEYVATKYLDLDVNPAIYTAKGVSDPNARYQLYSVYFSIPKHIEDQYGYLKKVKAAFYETRLAPVLFTKSDFVYNDFKARQDNKYKAVKGKDGAVLYARFYYTSSGRGVWVNPHGDYAFDLDNQWSELTNKEGNFSIYGQPQASINSKTKYNNAERKFSLIKKGELNSEYKEYADKLIKEFGMNPKDMPQYDTTAEDEQNKRSASGHRVIEYLNTDPIKTQSYQEKSNWFKRLRDFGFMHPDVSSKVDVGETIKKVESDILSGDAEEKYRVDKYYLEKLRKFYIQKTAGLENTYLLRYAVRKIEYHERITLTKCVSNHLGDFMMHTNPDYGYGGGEVSLVKLPMFLDFNIISLTFQNKIGETEIFVKSNPVNIVGDLVGPVKRDRFLGVNWKLGLDKIKKVLKIIGIILGVLLLVTAVTLVTKVVPKGPQKIKLDPTIYKPPKEHKMKRKRKNE